MQRLPGLREPRGWNFIVHAALGVAAVWTLGNFFTTLDRLNTQRAEVAQVLFHPSDAVVLRTAGPVAPTVLTNRGQGSPAMPALHGPTTARGTAASRSAI